VGGDDVRDAVQLLRSEPTTASAICRSTASVCSAPFASASSAGTSYAVTSASSRGSPKHRTCTSIERRSAFTSSAAWTPAPP
jgi:hypothetical protein